MALARQGIFTTITINGVSFPRPNDFGPVKENVYAGEITTCTGKRIADCIGWRWADMTLEWDYLPASLLNTLVNLNQTTTIQFDMPTSYTSNTKKLEYTTYSEDVILKNRVIVGSRGRDQYGNEIWHDIKLEVSFVNVS